MRNRPRKYPAIHAAELKLSNRIFRSFDHIVITSMACAASVSSTQLWSAGRARSGQRRYRDALRCAHTVAHCTADPPRHRARRSTFPPRSPAPPGWPGSVCHLQFSQIWGHQPYPIVRKSPYLIFPFPCPTRRPSVGPGCALRQFDLSKRASGFPVRALGLYLGRG